MATREELIALANQAEAMGDYETANRIADDILAMKPIEAKGLDVAKQMAVSAVAEPVKGLVGLGTLLTGGDNEQANVNMQRFQSAREQAFPQSQQGQTEAQAIAENPVMSAIGKGMEYISKGAGNMAFEATGSPLVASIAEGTPSAIMQAAGLKGTGATGSMVKGAITPSGKTSETLARENLIQQGKDLGVRTLTTDVLPPTTGAGKLVQQVSDSAGFLGTGGSRAKQQVERQKALTQLVKEHDIDIDTPFADDIVRSLNKKSEIEMAKAAAQRAQATTSLNQFGDVPASKTISAIDKINNDIKSLGATAEKPIYKTILTDLDRYKRALADGGDFDYMVAQRSDLIKDVLAAGRGEDPRAASFLNNVKQSLDQDMMAFARTHDKAAAKDWLHSNRRFSKEFQLTKETELKNILEKGDATPEKVMPIIRGGKVSELNRLHDNLTKKGRVAAQNAFIQDVLKSSKYFEGEGNPTLFVNELNRPNRQIFARTFFKGDEGKGLNALKDVLDATRAAQEASAMPKTGFSGAAAAGTVGTALMGGIVPATLKVTVPLAAIASGAAKAYESQLFRDGLVKLANLDSGSKKAQALTGQLSKMVIDAAEVSAKTAVMGSEAMRREEEQKLPVIDVQQGFQDKQVEPMQDPQAMMQQAEQVKRQSIIESANKSVQEKADNLAMAYKVPVNRNMGIDLGHIASLPPYVGTQLLREANPQTAPINEAIIRLAMGKPENRATVKMVKNVLQNNGMLLPDSVAGSVQNMVASGIKPEKAVQLATAQKTIKPQEAKKIAELIRGKLSPDIINDFAPLLSSIEALA